MLEQQHKERKGIAKLEETSPCPLSKETERIETLERWLTIYIHRQKREKERDKVVVGVEDNKDWFWFIVGINTSN